MTRKPTYEELKKEVNALKIEIVEWEKKNESLREAYDEFKQKMESSTSELIEANKELKQKIEEVGDINQGLKDSQHFLQTLNDTIEGVMFVKDAHGKYLYVNKAYGENFGVDPNEVIGKDDYFVFSPETAEMLQKNDRRIMDEKKAVNIEESTILKGKNVTYLTNKIPLIDDDGNVHGICGVGFDIIRQKEMEEKLRASEEKYQNLVENSYDIVYSVTPDGVITFIGPQIDRFGYEPEDVISKHYLEFVVPEQRQKVANSFEKGTRDGTSFPTEFQWLGKDGKRHWVEAIGKILYDDSDNPRLQIGILRDIVGRKRAEDVLRESEAKYQDLYDNAPDMFVSVDAQTANIFECNQTLADALGYTKEEIIGRPIFDMYTPESAEHAKANVFPVFVKNGTIEAEELQLQRKDGSKIDVTLNASAVRDDQGGILYSRSIWRDITKRKEIEQLEADQTYLRDEIKLAHNYENIVGDSDMLKYVLFRAEQIAPTDTTVLILGETGTGKELIARAIHDASPRRIRPLIKVDCASLSANLIESELFGHEKGAFTGADKKRIGRFELAHGATLFLDEIGELPLDLQPKLLRVLQDGEFERLGSSQTIRTDVRVIAATNRNLEEDVRKKNFRMDLWYRLSVFSISIPPLRERVEDIVLLANYMIKNFERKHGKRITSIPTSVLTKLQDYSWYGNVREMENVIERAVINTQGDALQLADALDAYLPSGLEAPDLPMKSLAALEREHILHVLKNTNWKIHGENGAADLLDINPSTLRGRMRKYGIHRPPYKV